MTNKAAILFSSFGPYHTARIGALARHLAGRGIKLVAFRFTETSDTYGWQPETPKEVEVVTLGRSKGWNFFQSLGLAYRLYRELCDRDVDSIFLPSFSPLPNFLCLVASKLARCRTVLMTESWRGTEKASVLGRLLKHCIVRLFDSALVGGTPQTDYVAAYGLPQEKIFTGYDVVDVEHFSKSAECWRLASALPIPGLPAKFFLNLGRFVAKKNLSTLLAAYARYVQETSSAPKSGLGTTTVALVLVGEGPLRDDLELQAQKLGLPVRDGQINPNVTGGTEVVFYPFQQADLTPLFFSRCEAFVLPSSREEWGLVVNEAMACGAPVLVSDRVGAHFDLVEQGVNGFTFNPQNVEQLAGLLCQFAGDSNLRGNLGKAGRKKISAWTPERFGDSGLNALCAAE